MENLKEKLEIVFYYMNNMDETVMLEIEGTDNLLTHYNIHLQSRANVKEDLKIMNSVDNAPLKKLFHP